MAHEAHSPSDIRARAQARLEASLEEQKRSFLRMVSHELRTPLNSILGFSEILTAELYGPLGSPQYKEYAEIIHGSGRKLLKLVNQVLEIARLEGRTVEFNPDTETLEAALDDVLKGLQPEMEQRDVHVVIEDRGRMPPVTADFRGLRSALTQLLHNAVIFSPEAGVVTVSAQASGGEVDIHIHNDGVGIDPNEVHRLLAPFQQGENALTRKTEGAGLGLPIAGLTCRAMGGRLTLASAPGEGLTATIRLPAG